MISHSNTNCPTVTAAILARQKEAEKERRKHDPLARRQSGTLSIWELTNSSCVLLARLLFTILVSFGVRVVIKYTNKVEHPRVARVCRVCFPHFWQRLKALPGLRFSLSLVLSRYMSAAALRIVFSDFMTKIIER